MKEKPVGFNLSLGTLEQETQAKYQPREKY